MSRPETGPMRFGDDWTGVFLRGDWAGPHAMYLRQVLDDVTAGKEPDPMALFYAGSVARMLAGCDERSKPEGVQVMWPFEECVYSKRVEEG